MIIFFVKRQLQYENGVFPLGNQAINIKIVACHTLIINSLLEQKLKYKFFRPYFENKDLKPLTSMRSDVLFEVARLLEAPLTEATLVGPVHTACLPQVLVKQVVSRGLLYET